MDAAEFPDTSELARGASVSLAGRIGGRVVHLLTQIGVGRLFGAQAYGLYAIGLTIMRIGGLVAVMGMDTAVLRYGARYRAEKHPRFRWVLTVGIGIPLAVGVLVGGGIFLAAPWMAARVFKDPALVSIIRWFALGIGPLAGLQAAAAATRISKRMQFSILSEELTQPALALLLILIASLLGLGLLGATAATVLSVGAALIVAVLFVGRLFPEVRAGRVWSNGPWFELVTYSVTVSGSRVFILLMTWIDRLVLGSFRPAVEVGVYQAAAQSSVLFAIILGAFNSILSPLVADLWHRGELDRLEAVFRISTKWGLYLSLPFFLVICSVPSQILAAVFGAEYAAGAAVLVVLATGQLINAGTGGVGLLLSLTGYQTRWVIASLVTLLLDIGLILLLVPRYGMLGAAVATASTLAGLYLIGLVQVRGALSFWPYDLRYLKGLVSTLVCAPLVYGLGQLPLASSLVGLAALTAAALAVFAGVLLALGLDSEDRQFLSLVRNRVQRIRNGNDA